MLLPASFQNTFLWFLSSFFSLLPPPPWQADLLNNGYPFSYTYLPPPFDDLISMRKLSNSFIVIAFTLILSIYIIYTFVGFDCIVFNKPKFLLSPTEEIPKQLVEGVAAEVPAILLKSTSRRIWASTTKKILCPNLESKDYISSYDILNSKIAIVIAVLSQKDYEDYMVAINTTQCYAKHFGYQMHLINMTDDPRIQKICNQTDVCLSYEVLWFNKIKVI